jgi:RNA-directed DNA polymerase
MESWSAHQLQGAARPALGEAAARSLAAYARHLQEKDLAVVFSLRHLAKICGVDYMVLRGTVDRRREGSNYRMFPISKRSGGLRFIHAPTPELLRIQQFLNQEILQKVAPHRSSYAFHPSGGIRRCAAQHCRARFLFQFDLSDFFHTIDESDVYHVFASLGYRPLLAFELARICTTTHLPMGRGRVLEELYRRRQYRPETRFPYQHAWIKFGVLPQGAPTSPMLGNLAAHALDAGLAEFAACNGLVYTRYADDLTFSALEYPAARSIGQIRHDICSIIRHHGFRVNARKTRIARAGSRKIVLGLLVDGDEPRVPRWTVIRIDRFLHAIEKFGLASVAARHGFDSAYGFFNHLQGLAAYIKDVDPPRYPDMQRRLNAIVLPWQNGAY